MAKENSQIGYLYAIAAAMSYGAMSFLVHLNPQSFPPEQLVFQRGLLSVLCLLPFCIRDLPKYLEKSGYMLWIRSAAGSVGVMCYFYALQGTASANANLLFSTTPVFVSALSWLIFREKVTRSEALGIFLIILGNIFLYIPHNNPIPLWVGIVGTVGALFASIAFLSLSEATKTYSSSLIVFGFSVMSMVFAFAFPGKEWLPITVPDFPFLLSVAALGLLSQMLATLSFAHLKSPVATAIGRGSIIFSGVLDILITRYRPVFFEIASYFTVILGVYVVHRYRNLRQKSSQITI